MRLAAAREDMPVSALQRLAMKKELRRLGVSIGGQRFELSPRARTTRTVGLRSKNAITGRPASCRRGATSCSAQGAAALHIWRLLVSSEPITLAQRNERLMDSGMSDEGLRIEIEDDSGEFRPAGGRKQEFTGAARHKLSERRASSKLPIVSTTPLFQASPWLKQRSHNRRRPERGTRKGESASRGPTTTDVASGTAHPAVAATGGRSGRGDRGQFESTVCAVDQRTS
jgi:hypothetical protein